jgi:hypothetical protein
MTNGTPTQVPALLDQLDKAVTERRGGAGCTSGGTPSPISTAALSLKQDIEKELRDHQRERVGYEAGTTKGILHAWATLDGEWADFLARVTLGWCDRIIAMLQPVKPPRRLHRPCPSCGVLYGGTDMKPGLQVHCWAEDETMLPPGDWTAECQHCGAAWSGPEISWLTRAVNV